MVDFGALKSDIAELGSKIGITSSSITLYSSPASTPNSKAQAKAQAKDDQPPLTRAIIYAFGRLAKVVDLYATRVESIVPKLVEVAIWGEPNDCYYGCFGIHHKKSHTGKFWNKY